MTKDHGIKYSEEKMKKRTVAVILAVLMLASSFASCSNNSSVDNQDNANETSASTEAKEAEETEPAEEVDDIDARKAISDDLPDTKFDGREYRILTTEGGAIYGFDYSSEIIAEELTGDACNDAVYNRNIDIETRFDTKITCQTNTSPSTYIGTFVQSGTDEFEVVGMYNFLAFNAINSGAVYNWCEVPHINLEKPWHNSLANTSATINGRLYAICSDLAITSMLYTHAFFFNSTLLEQYGTSADDMYNLVKEGKWTIDKAIEITSPIYEDLDGNGQRDASDRYGFGYSIWNAADVWLAAFDQPICKTSDEGVEMTFMTDKTTAIVEKLCKWHYDTNCFFNYPNIYEEETRMRDGTLVFAPIRFKACFDALRDMEDPYCMIPYPKWDEAQAQYLTNADDKFTVFSVPLTAVNSLDFVGTIYEALSAESYKTVYPTYYDTALKGKYSSDPTTAEMVDLIMAGRNFDFSFQFAESCFKQIPYWVRQALQSNDPNIASKYASIQKALNKSIEKTLYPVYGLSN